jgi:DNA repair exonuclease SbcCD ATPase subunit
MPTTEAKLSSWGRTVARLRAQQTRAGDMLAAAVAELEVAKGELEAAMQALTDAREIGRTIQQQAHARIAQLVTRCLAAVFEEDPYEFDIAFEQRAGRTVAALAFLRAGRRLNPTEAAGGGACDVAAFALRTACIMLARPPRRRLLLLDEPFRYLSREYRPRARALIEALSQELDVQFIIVTHDPEFIIGTVIEVRP